MKYIDAEKLESKINFFMSALCEVLPNTSYVENKELSVREASHLGAYKALEIVLDYIDSLQQEQSGVWIKVSEDHPLPYGQEVIGYNKEWVHEDFNPSGTRIGFYSDTGFFSAKWVNDQDCYATCLEEGDDYETFQIQPDGTMKTWCRHENGEAVEGCLPNLPTHYMLIPRTPDGFAWPYNTEKEN